MLIFIIEAINELFHGAQFDWSNEELLGNMFMSSCTPRVCLPESRHYLE